MATSTSLTNFETGNKVVDKVIRKFLELSSKSLLTLVNPESNLLAIQQAGSDIDKEQEFLLDMLTEFTKTVVNVASNSNTVSALDAVNIGITAAFKKGFSLITERVIVTETYIADTPDARKQFIATQQLKSVKTKLCFDDLVGNVKEVSDTTFSTSSTPANQSQVSSVVLKKFVSKYTPETVKAIRSTIWCSNNKKSNGCTKVDCQFKHPFLSNTGTAR